VKASILQELNKKVLKWDDTLKGMVVSFKDVKILNGGKGSIMDDLPHIHYTVRYTVSYAQPEIGESVRK
jgi:hypothetical protein